MLKKIAFSAPLAILALSSSFAFAEESRNTINITAKVPSSVFHAQPVDPNFGKAETMDYDIPSGTLSSLRANYFVKHTDGAVGAYVEGGPQPLFNGADEIALTYTFNGVLLTAVSKEVVTEAAAKPGLKAELAIVPATPATDKFGVYTATPVVVFDAIPKVTP
jgi:hypothetical protein